ncbi:MAG: hypothetical protein QME55_00505 [Brevundimonas sp.]|uniref:hypothetical protein n=1 Tax=Brevundimonas sp. TaxID=1871086 RepID=UPI00262560ED|nr:hypothetical protein [Brevundimonas sp.]MDI6623183.1 hypothetical protein [Brevundimonas sp.]MDQ7811214.1 hypothetical protein [Brevundimonas sp.]
MAVALAAAAVSGCATRASGVAPVAIAATDYSNMPCPTARERLVMIREQVNALSRKQNNAALADTAGVVLLLLPVGSIFGANVEGELAQAKGEQAALERHIVNDCGG